MSKMTWNRRSASKDVDYCSLSRTDGTDLYEEAVRLRHLLIDELAELDHAMMDKVTSCNSYDDVTAEAINDGLRRVTCNNKAIPVLLGSALKNCGVQPLLDAIVNYLPSPEENNRRYALKDELCAFVFKTIHQKERGAVTFLRLYNGCLQGSSAVYNATKECNDKIGRLYTILADQMVDVKTAHPGLSSYDLRSAQKKLCCRNMGLDFYKIPTSARFAIFEFAVILSIINAILWRLI